MKKLIILSLNLVFTIYSSCYSQTQSIEKGLNGINTEVIKAQLGFLASDWTEGRMIGEKGVLLSADYISSMLQLYGVKPGGDYISNRNRATAEVSSSRSYFQNFSLLKTVSDENQILQVKSVTGNSKTSVSFIYNVDFTLRPSLPDVEIDAPVVFVGYGFKNDKIRFNDLNKLDIKGKFILKITGYPKFVKNILTSDEIRASEREFETYAKTNGACGIIETDPNSLLIWSRYRREQNNMSPSENTPRPAAYSASYTTPGKTFPENIIRISVSLKTANEVLKGTGNTIEEYLKKADENLPYSLIPSIQKTIFLKTSSKTTAVPVKNVVGIIEGKNADQVIVLGAHYDHMGMSNGYIWNGADDNGSGTIGVMTIAKAIMETGEKPDKTIIIALWTAEEEGLLGSRYWVQNPTAPLENVKLNVNFDMISRYISDDEPNKVTMTYTISKPEFKDITVANINKYGLELLVDYQPSADPPGGTDHRSFVAAGIPVMRFKPGHREEYHTPKDEIETVNWDLMEKIIKISFADIWELANSDW